MSQIQMKTTAAKWGEGLSKTGCAMVTWPDRWETEYLGQNDSCYCLWFATLVPPSKADRHHKEKKSAVKQGLFPPGPLVVMTPESPSLNWPTVLLAIACKSNGPDLPNCSQGCMDQKEDCGSIPIWWAHLKVGAVGSYKWAVKSVTHTGFASASQTELWTDRVVGGLPKAMSMESAYPEPWPTGRVHSGGQRLSLVKSLYYIFSFCASGSWSTWLCWRARSPCGDAIGNPTNS